MLRAEAESYDPDLAAKPHIVALTKSDLLGPDEEPPVLEAPDADGVFVISAAAKRGLEDFKERLWQLLLVAREEMLSSPFSSPFSSSSPPSPPNRGGGGEEGDVGEEDRLPTP
jgi:GTPase involved in cell partitioning and DNA repair